MGARQRKRRHGPDNLYQRSGVWYGRITVDGLERRQSLKTRDRAEAERRLEAWLRGHSPYHGTTRHTFQEAGALWFSAGQWKDKTAKTHADRLLALDVRFAGMFWDQIDKAALQQFVTDKRAEGTSVATINRYLSVVSCIADHVRELPGWPEINPVKLLSVKSRRERRLPYVRPPAADIEAYFARMRGTFGDLCRVALECGARKDELVYLKRSAALGGQATFYDTKNHVPRTISWSPTAREIVDRQPATNSPYLFVTRDGGPYKRVTEMWREVVIRAQMMAQREGRVLTRMRFHDLRHEYAIRYLENGGTIYRLKELLGHGTLRQTERYLIYLTPDQAEHARMGLAQSAAQ